MKATSNAMFVVALCAWFACAEGEGTPKPGEMRINPTDGAEMVWIPGGKFLKATGHREPLFCCGRPTASMAPSSRWWA